MPENWTIEKEDKLVDLWRERRCLFAVNSPDYSDRVKKISALAEIAMELATGKHH